MIKLASIALTIFIAVNVSGKPQQPQQPQTTQVIPSYVVLPQIPNNLTPPPPGQPSSFSINQIRIRRAAANITAFSSPSASFSSSMSSSEENQSKSGKKSSTGLIQTSANQKPKLNDDSKLIDTGKPKIEAYSAPLAQIDLPGMMTPVTHRMLVNETTSEGLAAVNTTGTTAVGTTVTAIDVKNTTIAIGH